MYFRQTNGLFSYYNSIHVPTFLRQGDQGAGWCNHPGKMKLVSVSKAGAGATGGHILYMKMEPVRFAEGLNVGYERKMEDTMKPGLR